MRTTLFCEKSAVETSDQSYCEKLKSEWLSLTLLVVGIVTILVAQFVLFDTWRYVTMIGGGFVCALSILGFTITPKPVEKKQEGFIAFWERVKTDAAAITHSTIIERLRENAHWLKEKLANGMSPLHYLITHLKFKEIGFDSFRLIVTANLTVDAVNHKGPDGNTALHLAAQEANDGVYFIIKALGSHMTGINLDIQNDLGETPLHCAYKALYHAYLVADPQPYLRNIKILESAGAKTNLRTTAGQLPNDLLGKKYWNATAQALGNISI